MKIMTLLVILLMPAMATGTEGAPYSFNMTFSVVGVDAELDAKDYEAAIVILESRALDPKGVYILGEYSTLCALYVMTKRLQAAANACEIAVTSEGSDSAYNNRGVYRAHLKDFQGALDDFHVAQNLIIAEQMRPITANRKEAERYFENHRAANPNTHDPLAAVADRLPSADVEEVLKAK